MKDKYDKMYDRLKAGGDAFPTPGSCCGEDSGMTLRDYFAAAALPGALGNIAAGQNGVVESNDLSELAKAAYALADAMLEQRKAKE